MMRKLSDKWNENNKELKKINATAPSEIKSFFQHVILYSDS